MTPAAIIENAAAEGVNMALTPAGTIKVAGDRVAVSRWLAMLREHKDGIIEALKLGAGDTTSIPADERIHSSLEDRIRVMAGWWRYTPADLVFALAGAVTDPAGWLELVEFDAAWRTAHPGDRPEADAGHA